MLAHQWLVGGVALTVGAIALTASVLNHEAFFRLAKVRMLEGLLGRTGARWACAALGCGLIVIGALIVSGKLPRKMPSAKVSVPLLPLAT